MAIRDQLNNIERVLGQLLEGDRASQEDRRLIKTELRQTNEKLNSLTPLPSALERHEEEDRGHFESLEQESAERHEENVDHMKSIDTHVANIEGWQNRRIGWSAAIAAVVGTGGVILGAAVEWFKK